jgi:nucleotide-binding universal stress UspA family protein
MFTTIVWATDGSPAADRALPHAKALAVGDNGKLIALHVEEHFPGRAAPYPVLADEEEIETKIADQVEEARTEGIEARVRVVPVTAPGAAHAIAQAARELGADAIVAGTRGHSLVAGLIVGSVTQRLLHIAPCPVLVVPAGKAAAASEAKRELSEVGTRR